MGERDSYAPGTFCWAELGTTDVEAATAFYAEVFGWEVDGTRFRLDGSDVAGVEAADAARWRSRLSVEDVDALAERVRELGGEVLAEPLDVEAAGRLAAVADPTGAAVDLWQPRELAGAARVNDAGYMCWNELASPDPGRAREFYGALLGWEVEPEETGYGVIRREGAVNGGIRPQQDGEPAHWLVYFTVESCDDAVAAVRAGGGSVIAGPMDTAMGRVAAVRDPQGAPFALFEGEVDP
ncbi:MAG TPA: VOC family protein [Solirubrobacteraceae bacterium]|nr:VOC family protein [Solirubrobacteraceae bacterium]